MPDPAVVVTPEPIAVAWLAVAVPPPTVELVTVGAVTELMLSQHPVMWMKVPAGMIAPVVFVTVMVVPAVVAEPVPRSPRPLAVMGHHPSVKALPTNE